jgi:uncharacterized protein YdaU (DUF1376 family)
LNYYRRFPGDYARDTQDLSLAQHGALALLLDFIYGNERALPREPDAHYRICRAFSPQEKKAVQFVIARYFEEGPEGLINPRAVDELADARKRVQASQANGAKGGRPKAKTGDNLPGSGWGAEEEPVGNPAQNPSGSDSYGYAEPDGEAIHTPSTNSQSSSQKRKQTAARFDAHAWLSAAGVPDELAVEWLDYRKAKRAPVTLAAVKEIQCEAGKAGLSLSDALRKAMARGWTGFEAEWVAVGSRNGNGQHTQEPAWRTEQRQRAAQLGGARLSPSDLDFVDVEARNVAPPRLG